MGSEGLGVVGGVNERTNGMSEDPEAAPKYLTSDSDERLIGRYAALARLSTSPRFNRPQMEVIKDEAADVRGALEARGMKFFPPGSDITGNLVDA